MKALIVKALVGSGLFAGSLVGGLAATGRLNHEGVANIPVLSALFPAPPPAEGGAGEAKDGHAAAGEGQPADAAHAGGEGHAADAAADGEQGPQGPAGHAAPQSKPPTREVGRSVVEPEKKAEGGGHGGGGGHGEPAAEDHGKADAGHGPTPAGEPHGADPHAAGKTTHPAERDLQQLGQELAGDRRHKYAPGGYFTFDGMPAGLTPDQLNDAWQRVQSVLADLDRRKTALDLREQSLKEMNEDIARRQRSIADELRKIEEQHRRLDQRIQQFQEQVKLVRNDEVAALKRNAATLGSFEDAKAAELIEDQWKSEKGQDEVLKTLEFMDKDRVNEILAALPKALVQDILQKRLRVSKEATPAGPTK